MFFIVDTKNLLKAHCILSHFHVGCLGIDFYVQAVNGALSQSLFCIRDIDVKKDTCT